jgi:hypothetical protein
MEILFEYYNPKVQNILDQPIGKQRNVAGFFPFINKSPINLNKFGIFNKFDDKNYSDNCLIHAIKCSGLTNIDNMKSIINVREFPLDAMNDLVNIIKLNFELTIYDERNGRTDKRLFKGNEENDYKLLKLYVRNGHFMLYDTVEVTKFYLENYKIIDEEKSINPLRKTMIKSYNAEKHSWKYANKGILISQVITILSQQDLLKPLTDEQYSKAIKLWSNEINLTNINLNNDYLSNLSQRRYINHPKFNIRQWLTLKNEDYSDEEITKSFEEIKEYVKKEFDLDVNDYYSLAELGNDILFTTHCFDNVYEFSGVISQFIHKCNPSPLQSLCYKKPLKLNDIDIVQIDKNSCYPDAYKSFDGIPSGKPIIIDEFDPYCEEYYYVHVVINWFDCKHKTDPFPLIHNCGNQFYDKTYFQSILKHYNVGYQFINGYKFNEMNKCISELTTTLYNKRLEYKKNKYISQLVIKRLLNSLWGKSIEKQGKTYQVERNVNDIESFKRYNQHFIYSIKRKDNDTYSCRLLKPILLNWNKPQFACNVLSYSRCQLHDLIYKAIDNDINIYYCNTDSLTMTRNSLKKLNKLCDDKLLGNEIGQFSIEVESYEFIALSPRKNIHLLQNGEYRIRYPKIISDIDEFTFFERLYDKINKHNVGGIDDDEIYI